MSEEMMLYNDEPIGQGCDFCGDTGEVFYTTPENMGPMYACDHVQCVDKLKSLIKWHNVEKSRASSTK